MATDEVTALQRGLLERTMNLTRAQLSEAEALCKEIGANENPETYLAIAQLIATNYLATATIRNAPK